MYEVGKKVIAVKNSNAGTFKKGDIRTLLGIKVCPNCSSLALDIGDKTTMGAPYSNKTECECGTVLNSDFIWYSSAHKWQPLSDISTELSATTINELLSETVEV